MRLMVAPQQGFPTKETCRLCRKVVRSGEFVLVSKARCTKWSPYHSECGNTISVVNHKACVEALIADTPDSYDDLRTKILEKGLF